MTETPAVAPRGLRIALVCPYSLSRPGGVQGQVLGLARAFVADGHRVTVFAPIDDHVDLPEGVDLVVTGRSVPLPSNGSRAPVSLSPRAAYRSVRSLRAGRFDVVHVHEPFSPGLPYALLLVGGLPPMVATFHRSGDSIFYTLLKPLARRRARRYAVRCAVSEAARTTAQRALDGEYVVLFNGVEIERYRDAEPWPTDGPTVLFLGRHEERKGLGVLLDAFALPSGAVSERVVGSTLWIAGDGPETERLRRLHPGSDRIRWLGVLSEEEKVRRLTAADILCAPSLGGESFGMVLVEAMAARTRVVASDIDGYRDAAGSDAVLVPPGDPSALADALGAVLERPAPDDADDPGLEREAVLDSASARAERWSMRGLADRYEAIYRDLVVGETS